MSTDILYAIISPDIFDCALCVIGTIVCHMATLVWSLISFSLCVLLIIVLIVLPATGGYFNGCGFILNKNVLLCSTSSMYCSTIALAMWVQYKQRAIY